MRFVTVISLLDMVGEALTYVQPVRVKVNAASHAVGLSTPRSPRGVVMKKLIFALFLTLPSSAYAQTVAEVQIQAMRYCLSEHGVPQTPPQWDAFYKCKRDAFMGIVDIISQPTPEDIANINRQIDLEKSSRAIVDGLSNNSVYRGNCPCPYSLDAAGNMCGGRSAYSRSGGASPHCY